MLPPLHRPVANRALALRARLPIVAFPHTRHFVNAEDVGEALCLTLLDGPPGIYNLAGGGVASGAPVMRELGLAPIPLPGVHTRGVARAVTRLPRSPRPVEAAEALTHPVLADATKSKRELRRRPPHSRLEALRAAKGSAALLDRDSGREPDRPAWTSESGRLGRTLRP